MKAEVNDRYGITLIIFLPKINIVPNNSPIHADLELVKTVVMAMLRVNKKPEITWKILVLFFIRLNQEITVVFY